MAEKEKVLFTQWIILLLIAPARMVHNDVNDRSILLHSLSPFINVMKTFWGKCSEKENL